MWRMVRRGNGLVLLWSLDPILPGDVIIGAWRQAGAYQPSELLEKHA